MLRSNTLSWKPKNANRLRAPFFGIASWRTKYWARGANKRAVTRAFEAAYEPWLRQVATLRAAKKAANNEFIKAAIADAKAAKAAKERARRVARTAPTPRRNNQVAASRHAGYVRSMSPRRRVLTARLPRNAAALARANAQLTNQLQNAVNALKANLHKRPNAKLRSPRSAHSR
jgi:hypothetical protein